MVPPRLAPAAFRTILCLTTLSIALTPVERVKEMDVLPQSTQSSPRIPRIFSSAVSAVSAVSDFFTGSVVRAQDVPAPAYVAFVEGSATLERDGQEQPATLNAPLVAGDRLRTDAGRVDVLFPDSTALDVDEYSTLDVQSPTLMRLVGGRVMLMVAGASDPAAAVRYQIDTPAASVRTDGPGEYRVAVLSGRDSETELAVLRGFAALTTERGSMRVRAGERSIARDNAAPSFPQTFNSARFDAFDRWSAARRDARIGSTSRPYLPPALQMYGGTFDQYGQWQYAAPYGYVWYPRVAPTWRPYYNGHWAPIRPYGWTWIGLDNWAWPTHHYGRWGFAGGAWFWAPASQWAPAWVSWGVAPGYVSWCPLGVDNRPVFALAVGGGDPWAGWVVVPRASFGMHPDPVKRDAIAPDRIPRSTPFAMQPMAPVAVPRTAARDGVASSFISRGAPPPRPGRSAWPQALPPTSQSASVRRPNLVPSPMPAAPTVYGPRAPDPQSLASARALGPANVRRAGPVGPPVMAAPRRESVPLWIPPVAAVPFRPAPTASPSATYAPRTPDPQGLASARALGPANLRRPGPVDPPTIAPARAPATAVPRSAQAPPAPAPRIAPAPAGRAPAVNPQSATAPRSDASRGAAARRP